MLRILIITLLIVFGIDTPKLYAQLPFQTNNTLKYNQESAKVEIDRIYQKLLKGESIEDLAETFSQDPGSYQRGGVIGLVNVLDKYGEIFDLATKNLKVDEVSRPFKTDFGYHIACILLRKNAKALVQHILIRIAD